MKTATLFLSFITAVCLLGCSKGAPKAKSLIPATAAEIAASPDYKLEHTTKSGLKLYVRPLTPEIAKSISEDSPDHGYLYGDEKSPYFFLVPVNKEGQIVDGDKIEFTTEQGLELAGFMMNKMLKDNPEFQKMMKEAAAQQKK